MVDGLFCHNADKVDNFFLNFYPCFGFVACSDFTA
jgi:hypothetical protein